MNGRKRYILAADVGTTSLKTCLYSLEERFVLEGSALSEYHLAVTADGRAEQNPDEWVRALADTVRKLLSGSGIDPALIAGISFCSQMQGLVLVDGEGKPLRPAMSYLDSRAVSQKQRAGKPGKGPAGPKIAGLPAELLLRSIAVTGIAPTSVKDPLWKYHWVREQEPDIFRRVAKWLDVKEYLILRLTGRAVMTRDSACATFLYDNRPGKGCWSGELCRLYGVDPGHLPEIIGAEEVAGSLSPEAAKLLALPAGLPVFGGGGDASLIGLGSGAVNPGDLHIYMGTSGWVNAVTPKRLLDLNHMIGSITCAVPGMYHYFSEQETAGKCMEWVSRHLALDEIGVYLEKIAVTDDPESVYASLFAFLDEVVSATEPGCGGVLFAPWLHGSRSPFEDPLARGIFFNIGLNTGKRMMIRAVVEGLCYNLRWMLESLESGFAGSRTIRFVGGGAKSAVAARILADVLERPLEIPPDPQNAGALGAAAVAAIGLGEIDSFASVPARFAPGRIVEPDPKNTSVYRRNFGVFKKLYRANRTLFAGLNRN